MGNTQLLCTFTTKGELAETLQQIKEKYRIVYNYIYVLQNKSNLEELFVTYNIDTTRQPNAPLAGTILIHRKKESNTLYTINALNELIKSLNRGVVDPSFRIDWQHYKNSILLTQHNELKTLNTKIHKIVDLV